VDYAGSGTLGFADRDTALGGGAKAGADLLREASAPPGREARKGNRNEVMTVSAKPYPSMDPRLFELLSSRLCHDLVGPVGAVSNGMELLEDEEFGAGDDAIQLVSKSARQTSDLLQFYRMAYGTAGSRAGINPEELFPLARAFLSHSKVRLDWPERTSDVEYPEGFGKLVLNLLAVGQEGLPRGGEIRLLVKPRDGRLVVDLLATGTDAGLRGEIMAALEATSDVSELTPRSVQGYFAQLLARNLGATVAVEQPAKDALRLSLEVAV
jgi:histidine phosphotransferase ChpT